MHIFGHLVFYLRDEKDRSSQKAFRLQPQSASARNNCSSSRRRSGGQFAIPFGPTPAPPHGSRFGFPAPQAQETHAGVVRPSGLSAGHARESLLSPLGSSDWVAGPMYPDQTGPLRAPDRARRHFSAGGPASPVDDRGHHQRRGSAARFVGHLRPGVVTGQHHDQALRKAGAVFFRVPATNAAPKGACSKFKPVTICSRKTSCIFP